MSDHDAFLRAVLDCPDDDLPRLVYADYLDERGNPRGEFIRAQVDLARLQRGDAARRPLEDRAYKLFLQHAETWAAPLRAAVRCPRNVWPGWVFERGFIRYVQFRGADLQRHAPQVVAVTPLQELCLTGANTENVDWLTRQPWARHLRTLILDGNNIGDDGAARLASSPALAGLLRLDLRSCGLHTAGISAVARSPYLCQLKWLDLSNNEPQTSAGAVLASAPTLANLTYLDLRGTLSRADELVRRFGSSLLAHENSPRRI